MCHHRDVLHRVLPREFNAVILLALALVAAPLPLPGAGPAEPESLPAGSWGGRGAELRVGERFAEIEFDCAMGRIQGPIRLQPGGEFSVAGTYVREPGGPGRVGDAEPAGSPAKFYGVRLNSEIRLSVQLIESGRSIGPFVLHQSQESYLEKCL